MLESLMENPTLGKFILERLKTNAFDSFEIPLSKALENQTRTLNYKFEHLEKTIIGKKLGVHNKTKLKNLPYTDYTFYEPFYENPSPDAFMYPLEEYAPIKTSGTTGKNKTFLIPRKAMRKALRETALPVIFALFHDGKKITMQYGDTFYLNMGPAPYLSGSMFNMGSKEKRAPFLNLVPNINLTYKEKVDYFILNYKKIDAVWIVASTLITQVIPKLKEPLNLKGIIVMDDLIAKTHKEDIEKFTGTSPKTCFSSTETISPTIPSIQHSMGFIFDPRRGIFEFAPCEKTQTEEIVGLDQVQVGKIYRLIYTDLIGEITRYDTTNAFKCIAKGDNIINTDYPIFEYSARLDATISIMNFTRIGETELLDAFHNLGLKLVDFTTKIKTEQGREYLHIYAELIDQDQNQDIKIEDKIHQYLYTNNPDYKLLADSFTYKPIKLSLLPKDAFTNYLENRKGSFPKICRIGISDYELQQLCSSK
ncbi:MAG: GH3 auxin-responsive promoter family protein [Nitrososphaerota archaeon]|jgi:hypothetical protein|nr:GH3 auxin-responsive promoter family protein [Nitrososphaerota archaeon]